MKSNKSKEEILELIEIYERAEWEALARAEELYGYDCVETNKRRSRWATLHCLKCEIEGK